MDMMTLTQLAQHTDLAPPTIRRYLDDFILYVPSVRVDNTIGFPPEAIEVITMIHTLVERGHSHNEILSRLEETYPITVISAQPLEDGQSIPSAMPAITSLLRAVDDRYSALVAELTEIRSDVDSYVLSGPLAHVPSELAQVRQVISMLAKRVAEASTATDPEISALRLEIAELRAAVRDSMTSASSRDDDGLLRHEIAQLKHQVAELRSERVQMLALMSGLQDTLAQIRLDRSDDPTGHPASAAPTPIFSLGGQPVSASGGQRTGSDAASPAGRTPRRLGHSSVR